MTNAPAPVTVLVVDDDPAICRFIEEALTEEGYAVVSAIRPTEAAKLASLRQIDVAVIDVVLMTRTSGIELGVLLSEQGVAVVLMSGDIATVARSGELGHPFVAKPFRVAHLLASVAAAVQTREMLRREKRLQL